MTDPSIPPPPSYPPSVGMPTTWWSSDDAAAPLPEPAWVEQPEPVIVYVQHPEPEPGPGTLALMVRHMHIAYNAPTLAVGCLIGPCWHQLIQLLSDNWIFAGTAVAGAILLDLLKGRWWSRIFVWTTVVGALLDLPVLDQMLRILTGVPL